jgi:cytochrome c-type biogenesis protein CcmH
MTARRIAPWLALGVVVLGAIAWAAWPSNDGDAAADRVRDLAAELRCPDCESQSVADSSTPTARAVRIDIRRRVEAGESDEQIRQAFVARYGESILLKPEGSGLGLIVWGLPVAVLVLGAGGLVVALRRWRREPRLHATDADESLVTQTRRSEQP